jgi:hypothetical protein
MIWLLVIVIVVLLVAVGALAYRQRRSAQLREGFGPEYDRAVREHGDQGKAEAELRERRERRRSYDIRPLDPDAQARYAERWQQTQARFVDQPASTTARCSPSCWAAGRGERRLPVALGDDPDRLRG